MSLKVVLWQEVHDKGGPHFKARLLVILIHFYWPNRSLMGSSLVFCHHTSSVVIICDTYLNHFSWTLSHFVCTCSSSKLITKNRDAKNQHFCDFFFFVIYFSWSIFRDLAWKPSKWNSRFMWYNPSLCFTWLLMLNPCRIFLPFWITD